MDFSPKLESNSADCRVYKVIFTFIQRFVKPTSMKNMIFSWLNSMFCLISLAHDDHEMDDKFYYFLKKYTNR